MRDFAIGEDHDLPVGSASFHDVQQRESFPPFRGALIADYAPNDVINEPTFFGYPSTTSQAALTGALPAQSREHRPLLAMLGVAPASQPQDAPGITDGTSNTILLCDAGRPIRWINNTSFPAATPMAVPGGAVCFSGSASTASRPSPIQLAPLQDNSPGSCVINCSNNNKTYFPTHAGCREPRLLRWVSSLHSGIHFRKHLRRLDYRGGRRSHSRGSLPQF